MTMTHIKCHYCGSPMSRINDEPICLACGCPERKRNKNMYTIEQIHENWLQGTMSEIVALYFLQDFGLKMEDAVKVMDEWKQKKEKKLNGKY